MLQEEVSVTVDEESSVQVMFHEVSVTREEERRVQVSVTLAYAMIAQVSVAGALEGREDEI